MIESITLAGVASVAATWALVRFQIASRLVKIILIPINALPGIISKPLLVFLNSFGKALDGAIPEDL